MESEEDISSDETRWDNLKLWLNQTLDKTKVLLSKIKEKLKLWTETSIAFLKKINIIQVLIAFALLVIGAILSYQEFKSQVGLMILLYFLIAIGAAGTCVLWYFALKKYFKKMIYYIVEHSFTRKIIAGGNYSYYEYFDPSVEGLRPKFTQPLGMIINSLIGVLGLATFIVGLIRIPFHNLDYNSPVLWGILAIFAPIIATPILPITWALDDAKVKSWSTKNNTTWTVSSKYKVRFNSIISIGAVLTNLRQGSQSNQLVSQLEIIWGILRVGGIVLFMTTGILIIYYYVWFKRNLQKFTYKSLNLKCYEIVLVEKGLPEFVEKVKEEIAEEDSKTMAKNSKTEEVEDLDNDESGDSVEETSNDEDSADSTE